MAIARQLITREYAEVVRTDGQVWSISRDQILAMYGAMSRAQAVAGIKQSLGEFLGIEGEDINTVVGFSTYLTGEIDNLTLTFPA